MAVVKCAYKAAGHRCGLWATDWREVPLRDYPPCPDTVEVALCDLHAKAVTIWDDARRMRHAEGCP